MDNSPNLDIHPVAFTPDWQHRMNAGRVRRAAPLERRSGGDFWVKPMACRPSAGEGQWDWPSRCRAFARWSNIASAPGIENVALRGTARGLWRARRRNSPAAVEDYLDDLRKIRSSGGATGERSYYPPLTNLLNAVGSTLKPKGFLRQRAGAAGGRTSRPRTLCRQADAGGAGNARDSFPKAAVVEVKPVGDDAWLTADGDQVSRYWDRYRLVLVTNTRDFVLLGEDAQGRPAKLETFRLAGSRLRLRVEAATPPHLCQRTLGPPWASTWAAPCRTEPHWPNPATWPGCWLPMPVTVWPGSRRRATHHRSMPCDLRWRRRWASGSRASGAQAFFRSTLVQTLFYGVFSAWVLWARQTPPPAGIFNWHEAAGLLRAPVLRALFWQLSDPGRLQPLGLVEVLDWTSAALDRVDRDAFFDKFNEGEAVPYFYEPFLEAFDPALRKQLGVWYTPVEVVRYMVARVDMALKDDLGIADGLAAENVYVLDPCCGTGAFLAETLRRIAANLQGRGLGALTGSRVKQAATQRVFGFEIMPAPFVVAHLQVGLTMQALDAPLSDDGTERAGVFLTNALTGWEPRVQKPLPFPELEEERDRADRVKQNTPVLVIIGNPPYNGFAGMAVEEERELSEAYRTTKEVRRPEGQGLNDLYVRFFRMAERRIAEKTGRGIVCFISNYSWLDGLSFTGMRERYLEAFDAIRIDNLHGDRIISEYAPDGRTSETVFAVQGQSPGIRIGTAITLLSRSGDISSEIVNGRIRYRDFHQARAEERRSALLNSLESVGIDFGYTEIQPQLEIGLPFKPMAVGEGWQDCPSRCPTCFPQSFPGVKTSRDSFLIDIDLDPLKARMEDYFNSDLSHEEICTALPVRDGFDQAIRRPRGPRRVTTA